MIGSSGGSVNVYLPVAYQPLSLPLIRFVGVVPRIVMQLVYLQIALSLLVTGPVLAIKLY